MAPRNPSTATVEGEFAPTALRPPVVARDLNTEQIDAMQEAIEALQAGEFASDGLTYSEREKAGASGAKYVRVIGSRSSLTLRSRTWEAEPGKWVFGIRPKD